MQLLSMRAGPAAGRLLLMTRSGGSTGWTGAMAPAGCVVRRHLGVVLTLAGEEGPEEEPR